MACRTGCRILTPKRMPTGGLAQNYRTITGKYILSDVMHDYFLKITFVMM